MPRAGGKHAPRHLGLSEAGSRGGCGPPRGARGGDKARPELIITSRASGKGPLGTEAAGGQPQGK